jgi:hypothetical protein
MGADAFNQRLQTPSHQPTQPLSQLGAQASGQQKTQLAEALKGIIIFHITILGT